MINARDIALLQGASPTPAPVAHGRTFAERLLSIALYVTVLVSSVAFIEPSPHDALMAVLALACMVAGVRFERPLLSLLIPLVIWNVAGLISLISVAGDTQAVQYAGTSLYLAVAALLFACLFAQDTLARLATLRSAYVLSAILCTLFGLAVYFGLLPGEETFTWAGRLRSTFKDPNVFGPFLILPALLMIEQMVTRKVTLRHLVGTILLLAGIFFSFSRGAWLNLAISTTILLALIMLTAPTRRARLRPVALGVASAVGLALALIALASIESVRTMLLDRAHLVQSYDVGQGGRFELQELALGLLLDHPLGLGPFAFANQFGIQQHNVYLQAFLVYGWLGGVAFIALIAVTLVIGLQNALMRTPWQFYLIAAYAAYVGIVVESFIIDSDHWRHFYLILGMIWGMTAANVKFKCGERHLGALVAA